MNEELKKALRLEKKRQNQNIELIASENYASKAVRNLQGSILTNKYAEGYSGKRYYGGCEYIEDIVVNVIMVVANISIFLKIKRLSLLLNYLIVVMLMFNLIQEVVLIWQFIEPF